MEEHKEAVSRALWVKRAQGAVLIVKMKQSFLKVHYFRQEKLSARESHYPGMGDS